MRALCIPVNGDAQVVDVEITLSWLQEQVGGYIQPVYVETFSLTAAGARSMPASG